MKIPGNSSEISARLLSRVEMQRLTSSSDTCLKLVKTHQPKGARNRSHITYHRSPQDQDFDIWSDSAQQTPKFKNEDREQKNSLCSSDGENLRVPEGEWRLGEEEGRPDPSDVLQCVESE
jgi:hypothetical protein